MAKKRKVTPTIKLVAEEDDIPFVGNASACGDAMLDKEVEDKIRHRLAQGDIWAWCYVTVTATYGPLSAWDGTGGCCYEDEEDFKRSGYYKDMVANVCEQLNYEVQSLQGITIVAPKE